MKTHYLERVVDKTGLSGTGIVAEVCIFTDGACAMRWLESAGAGVASFYLYDALEDLLAVHGHGGTSVLVDYFDREATADDGKTVPDSSRVAG
jgi:hypothetical protein